LQGLIEINRHGLLCCTERRSQPLGLEESRNPSHHHTRRLLRQQKKKRYEADKPGGSADIHDSFGHRLVRLLVKAESSSLRSPWSDPFAQDLATYLYR